VTKEVLVTMLDGKGFSAIMSKGVAAVHRPRGSERW
jgi:hypothetical protein